MKYQPPYNQSNQSILLNNMDNVFTDANFDAEVLKSAVPVFVDFWAPWCGPCRMMGPIVAELSSELDKTKIKIGKLNVDENPNTAQTYNVMSIPTFIMFKNGAVAEQTLGGMPKEKLKAFMAKSL
ncbi:MAG: thioredoxin [Candidatus Magasanikbacteria bacterium]|nr:thioredoxin [Candidatus Magasanikbacteria bacterium]